MAQKSKARPPNSKRATPKASRASVKNSYTSPFQIEMNKKRAEALDLRKQGYSYDQIAAHMDAAASTVHGWVVEAIARITRDAALDVLQMELARLDDYQASVYAEAADGDIPSIDACMRISDRRAKLLNLYPDQKTEATATMSNGQGGETTLKVVFVTPKANGHDPDQAH